MNITGPFHICHATATKSGNFLNVSLRFSSSFCPEVLFGEESRSRFVHRAQSLTPLRISKKKVKKHAAVLVSMCTYNSEACLLYTRRSTKLRSHRGEICFSGGNSDPGEDAITTALRETHEELGLQDVDVWCTLPEVGGKDGSSAITPVVGLINDFTSIDALRLNEHEVEQAFIVPIEKLANPSNGGYTQFRVKNSPGYSLPLFKCEPFPIWGLTAIITFQFLRTLLPHTLYKHNLSFQPPIKR